MGKHLALACILATACNGGNGDSTEQLDATVTQIDAGSGPDAMEENYCTVLEAMYGDQGAMTGTAILTPGNKVDAATLVMQMPLNTDASPDVLFLELWREGVFADGFSAKTVVLSGNQANVLECSACAYIAPDHVEGQSIDFHITYSGQLVIDTIDPAPGTGQVTGSLNDLKLHAVTIDGNGEQQITPMGCKTAIENITFDFAVALAEDE